MTKKKLKPSGKKGKENVKKKVGRYFLIFYKCEKELFFKNTCGVVAGRADNGQYLNNVDTSNHLLKSIPHAKTISITNLIELGQKEFEEWTGTGAADDKKV
jgi:hypothetical protein